MLKKIAVVIPSLDPDENMPQLVKNLCGCGFSRFVLVDDGSKAENRGYFEQAIQFAEETGADIRQRLSRSRQKKNFVCVMRWSVIRYTVHMQKDIMTG